MTHGVGKMEVASARNGIDVRWTAVRPTEEQATKAIESRQMWLRMCLLRQELNYPGLTEIFKEIRGENN